MGSFSLVHWIILGIIVFVIYRAVSDAKTGGLKRHCMTCGTDDFSKVRTRGSIWIEIILWLCFLVPGLIYSVWRLTTKREVCRACGSETIVPPDAPAAVSHRKSLAAS